MAKVVKISLQARKLDWYIIERPRFGGVFFLPVGHDSLANRHYSHFPDI